MRHSTKSVERGSRITEMTTDKSLNNKTTRHLHCPEPIEGPFVRKCFQVKQSTRRKGEGCIESRSWEAISEFYTFPHTIQPIIIHHPRLTYDTRPDTFHRAINIKAGRVQWTNRRRRGFKSGLGLKCVAIAKETRSLSGLWNMFLNLKQNYI